MVLVGLLVMILAIFTSMRIKKSLRPEIKQKWSIITVLMVAFLAGYGAFLFLQFQGLEKYLEIITGATFLGGAVFVFWLSFVEGRGLFFVDCRLFD